MNYFSYLRYLQYIPLAIQLVSFIRAAQGAFKDSGSNEQKLKWVAEQFSALVTQFELSGVLQPKLANALRNGSEALISIIVQFMNATDGEVAPGPMPDVLPKQE